MVVGLGSGVSARASVKPLRARMLAAVAFVALVFSLLVVRLYFLQILRGDEYNSKGQENFVRTIRIPHDRGMILDRKGRILVDNRASMDIQVTPAFLGDEDTRARTLEELRLMVELDDENFESLQYRIENVRAADKFTPIMVKRDLEPGEVEAIEAERGVFRFDGVEVVEGRLRTYPYGKLAAHLLGYVNEIGPERYRREKANGNLQNYRLGDVVGRAGVERRFEKELRGRDGYRKIVVDAKGRQLRAELVEELLGDSTVLEPSPGNNVVLTIDLELQQSAETIFEKKGRAGSAVAIDPNTGAILTMVSFPMYDPNRMSSGLLGRAEDARVKNDPLKPLYNRTISGMYPPGSTFKVVTAAAALSERVTNPKEKVFCPGYFRLGRHTWRCHKDSGHGHVDLSDALKLSCDTYFYTVANRMGINPIAEMARKHGMGSMADIGLLNEKPGLVPDEAWHDRMEKGGYQKGMAINTSIGQGALLVTPMQLAVAYATIANKGERIAPRFVERLETADFRVLRREAKVLYDSWDFNSIKDSTVGAEPISLQTFGATGSGELNIDDDQLDAILEGLISVTSEPGGTAYSRRSRKISMAGKTGTAQVLKLGRDRIKAAETVYFERDHAWFAAFAPIENPKIAIAVINEHSGHGGSKAAPIAVGIIDTFVDIEARALAQGVAP